MDLLLWRHAEAEEGIPDLKRKLTARGEKQAQQMAEWLRRHAPKNLYVVASPAVRCQQTAKALNLSFDTDLRLGRVAMSPICWPPHIGQKEDQTSAAPCSSLAINPHWGKPPPCYSAGWKTNGVSGKALCGGLAIGRAKAIRKPSCAPV